MSSNVVGSILTLFMMKQERRRNNGMNDGVFVLLWFVLNKWSVAFCVLDCLISTCFSQQGKSCTDQWLHPVAKLKCFHGTMFFDFCPYWIICRFFLDGYKSCVHYLLGLLVAWSSF